MSIETRNVAPSSADFRTAARVLRWGMAEAQRQLEELPWWKRLFMCHDEKYFMRLIVLCESEADDRAPNPQ